MTTEKKREICEYHVNNPNAKQADIGGKLAYSSSQTNLGRWLYIRLQHLQDGIVLRTSQYI
jgi:hypothetical protein